MRLKLTNREEEITYEYCSGSLYKEIADKLKISISTVKNHLVNIRANNNLGNSVDLVREYILQNPKKFILSIFFLGLQSFMIWQTTLTDLKTPRTAKARVTRTRKIS